MATARVRNKHQRKVDEVDIPSPTVWLHHDATAALRLRRDAQNNLQLLDPLSDRSRNPIYEQADDDLLAAVAGVSSYRASSGRGAEVDGHGGADTAEGEQKCVAPSRRFSKVYRNKTLRAVIGGEVLPWGAWPVRLRNHDGQDFYGSHGCPPLFVGGSEDIVHDKLGRWGADEQYLSVAEGHDEGTVKRLFPGTHGGWVEPPPPPPESGTARIGGTASIKATTPPRDPGSPTPCRRDKATSKKRLVPSWYGGWREIDDSTSTTRTRRRGPQEDERAQKSHRTLSSNWGRQTAFRGAAAESCVVSLPAAAGGGSTPTSSSGAPDSSTDDASTAATSERPLQRRRRHSRSLREQQGGGEKGRAEGEGEGGGKRKRSASVEGTPSGGSDSSDGHESGDGCERRRWQGWTVSEPANEAVRRVWGRARRRARDCFEPSHLSSPLRPTRSTACGSAHPGGGEGLDRGAEGSVGDESTIEEEEGGTTGGSSPGAGYPADGAIRETLDPVLLSCLGRECEGIIDAALGVVLEDRLRRASSSRLAGEDGTGSHQHPPSPPMANWEDVLRTMWSCSSIARKADTGAGAVAGLEVGSGERMSTDGGVSGAAESKGGEEGAAATKGTEAGAREGRRVWGAGDSSDGAVVVVNDSLPGLPLNEAVLTRSYNRLLLCLHEKKPWAVERCL